MDIVSNLSDIAKAVGDMLVQLFTSITSVFYTPATTEGGTGSLTFVGVLCIIVLAIGLALLVLNWVRSIIHRD